MKKIKIYIIYFFIFVLFISIRLFPRDLLSRTERDYWDKNGTINIIGDTKYPPFYFVEPNGEIDGITPDILRWAAVELGLKMEFNHSDFHSAMKSVLAGKNDVMCDLFYSKARDSLFDFTEPLYKVKTYIFVPTERTDIHSLNDLNGKMVAIQKGDFAIGFLGKKGIKCKIIETADFESAIEKLIKGKADAVVGDDPVIMYYAYKLKVRKKIKRVGEPLYMANSCLAVRKGDTVLLNILNKCVKLAEQKNTINRLTLKWFGMPLNGYKESLIQKYAPVLVYIVLILLIIVFSIWFWNFRLQKSLRERTIDLRKSLNGLHNYKEEMENVLETIKGYIWWGRIDSNGEIVDWNCSDSVVRITGYEKENFRTQDTRFWEKLIYPEDLEMVVKAFYELENHEKEINMDYRIVTNNGKIKWLSENVKIIKDKKTGEKFVNGICFDTTEMTSLEYKRAYFKSLFESLNEAVVITDNEGNFVDINNSFTELFGYSKSEVLGKNYTEVMTNEGKDTYIKNIRKKLSEKRKLLFEAKRRSKDGTLIDVLITVSPVIIKSEIQGAIILLIDLRERVRLIEQIKDERERLRTILRSIGETIIVTDIEGKIDMLNRIAEIHLGIDSKNIKGVYFAEVLKIPNTDEKKEIINSFDKAIRNREVVNVKNDVNIIRKDNREYMFKINISPIFAKSSDVKGVVIVLNDVTYLHKMENTLIRAKNLESLGVLAGGIAHDFNNYLTAILGNIEIAEMKEKTNGDMKQLLDKMKDATIDAKNLTMQLLTFAKGDTNLKEITFISDLIKDTVSFVLSGSKSNAKVEIDENLWDAVVDKGQIKNVVSNLLINAEQSMPEGGNITVKANNVILTEDEVPQLPLGKYIKIDIIDEGKGIPKDVLDNIFDPYFTTKRMGSGLGLATAHSIVKNHGGLIKVESEVGKGSQFTIYLPASSERIGKKETVINKNIKIKARILVMDDEKMIRDVVGEMLNIMGYEVDFAADGNEAIKKYKDAMDKNMKFDVVLLDLTIPGGMGGRETIKKLLELDPMVKGIVVSGYSTDVIISKYKKYGFKNAVLKPFQMEELSSALKEVLNSE
ncbi:MAG: PAS domain S-box protein [Proteobacteria bacterium]|nr:PAS domain S-box protein [Pseudomonadota bacterium]